MVTKNTVSGTRTEGSLRCPRSVDFIRVTICIECHRSFKLSKVSFILVAQCVSRCFYETYDLTVGTPLAMLIVPIIFDNIYWLFNRVLDIIYSHKYVASLPIAFTVENNNSPRRGRDFRRKRNRGARSPSSLFASLQLYFLEISAMTVNA